MGFLDFLFDKEKKEERKYARLEKQITEMYGQAAERAYVIEELREMATPQAVEILMKRFGEACPNTTVDIDEKQRVYDILVELGGDPRLDVRGVVRRHLEKTDELINWPMKVMSDLLSLDEFVALTRELLAGCSTEYQQNPEKKQELILRAQELKDPELARELIRFLDDMNETIRFLAVDAVLAQDQPELAVEPLADRLVEEESLRIVQKLAEAFAKRQNWKIPEEKRAEVAEMLPDEYGVHDQGHVYKHRH